MHTPGPYKKGTRSDGTVGVYDTRDGSYFSRNSWSVPDAEAASEMLNIAYTSGQRDANADLLAACEKFVRWIDDGQPAATQNVVADAEAAIAKAHKG